MSVRPCEVCTVGEHCSPEDRMEVAGCPFRGGPDRCLLNEWADELETWINGRDWYRAGGLTGNVVRVIEAKAKAVECVKKLRRASEGK